MSDLRVLIVDDDISFATGVAKGLRGRGVCADAIMPRSGRERPNLRLLSEDGSSISHGTDNGPALEIVRKADVIFLDHRMPTHTGEQMLDWWRSLGVDLESKRIVGTSSGGRHSYLDEHFDSLAHIDSAMSFLGLQD